MELLIYNSTYVEDEPLENFKNFQYALNMKHLASDLLEKGLRPEQISEAFTTAIAVANASGIPVKKHFMPVYSAINKEIIHDCKLSHLAYGLVLMNADLSAAVVREFQIGVLTNYLNEVF
ncbi:hypothetical protein MWU59_08870 [Flavobacteriaceae bacterium F08102]|nr:hypothetical protein [Flavobacteriaceae bacterium F08102]